MQFIGERQVLIGGEVKRCEVYQKGRELIAEDDKQFYQLSGCLPDGVYVPRGAKDMKDVLRFI